MGTSNWQNIPFCVEAMMKIAPERVLDIGVGFGRWGMVTREFCDVWQGRVFRRDWRVQMEGVEAFPANIDEYHYLFYNQIHLGDFREFAQQSADHWNLIIFGDVLEHFTKAEGLGLLSWALSHGDYVLVNIPLGEDWPQGEAYGNKYEQHLSAWGLADFENYNVRQQALFSDYIGRLFGSFVLSRADPARLSAAAIASLPVHHPSTVEAECQQLQALLQAANTELQAIKSSRSYRLIDSLRRTPAAPLLVRLLRLAIRR